MRNIKYILVNATPVDPSSSVCVSNLGHHYVINSQGMLLHPIDDSQPGAFMPKPTCGEEDLNRCSIGIKYNGDLARDLELSTLNSLTNSKLYTLNSKLAGLLALLSELRKHFPNSKILDVSEINGRELHCKNIIVSDAMNVLRRELSDYM